MIKRVSFLFEPLSDMDPLLAKSIAMGDVCPITRLPMLDINAGFIPKANKKPLPRVSVSPSKSRLTKGKTRESLPTGGILSFFGNWYKTLKYLKVLFENFRTQTCHSTTNEDTDCCSDTKTWLYWQSKWKAISSRNHG